jgi:hypothetical protein
LPDAISISLPGRRGETLYIRPHCGIMGKNELEILNGQKGVFPDPKPFGKNSKPNGTVTGHFSQGYTKFRAGMEEHPCVY